MSIASSLVLLQIGTNSGFGQSPIPQLCSCPVVPFLRLQALIAGEYSYATSTHVMN